MNPTVRRVVIIVAALTLAGVAFVAIRKRFGATGG